MANWQKSAGFTQIQADMGSYQSAFARWDQATFSEAPPGQIQDECFNMVFRFKRCRYDHEVWNNQRRFFLHCKLWLHYIFIQSGPLAFQLFTSSVGGLSLQTRPWSWVVPTFVNFSSLQLMGLLSMKSRLCLYLPLQSLILTLWVGVWKMGYQKKISWTVKRVQERRVGFVCSQIM